MIKKGQRNYVPKEMYLLEHGTECFFFQYLRNIFKMYDMDSDYENKKIAVELKEKKIWCDMGGIRRIRKIPWMDYLPKRWEKNYEESL